MTSRDSLSRLSPTHTLTNGYASTTIKLSKLVSGTREAEGWMDESRQQVTSTQAYRQNLNDNSNELNCNRQQSQIECIL